MMKLNRFFLLVAMTFLFSFTAFADNVIYSPDSLTLPSEGLTRVRVSERLGNGNVADNWPKGNPDGYVVKPDSPYFNPSDDFGGQDELTKDMQINAVKKYPNYEANPWRGKPWDKIPSYWKMSAHMEKPVANALIGWDIFINVEVQSSVANFNEWWKVISSAGYDDDVAAEFVDNDIIVNTKYIFLPPEPATKGVLFRASGSEGPGIMVQQFIPLIKIDVKDKFVNDFNAWQNKPKLKQVVNQSGLIEFIK